MLEPEIPPFVSVIMPVRNEADFIAESLGAVLSQDYPHNRLEVLIADGMSTDSTRQLIQQTSAKRPEFHMQIVDNPARIVPAGFNRALAAAQGQVIVRVDGHTVIAPDYVTQCVRVLQETNADNVGGRMHPVGLNDFGRAVALATSSPVGMGGARFHYSQRQEWVDTVYLGAWRREIFDRVGWFDEEFVRNQDDEFNYRLLSKGGRILLDPRIRSQYYNRSTPSSLWRQYFQYGFWKVRVMQKHPRQMRLRQFAPPALVIALIAGALASFLSVTVLVLFMGLTAVYILALIALSFWTSRCESLRMAAMLLLAFAVLHIAYGLGFLTGLIHFGLNSHRDMAA